MSSPDPDAARRRVWRRVYELLVVMIIIGILVGVVRLELIGDGAKV